ncbi:hypothetical protein BNJ_00324 [Kaumoebavirus]|nr:hypothetical protein BNJ_00324 [Kaumoebavirus]ARA72146.1 hypothetical protein BNJ_00324 [Kaumoebavirus]
MSVAISGGRFIKNKKGMPSKVAMMLGCLGLREISLFGS